MKNFIYSNHHFVQHVKKQKTAERIIFEGQQIGFDKDLIV
jgi:hypothetical protein